MVRAAAKNHAHVGIVTSPDQYETVLAELREHGRLTEATRRAFALEAFARTAAYDAAIVEWLQDGETLPQHLIVPLARTDEVLRYGENPHQHGARYRKVGTTSWWDGVEQHSGVALSYLNLYDTEAAWKLAHDLGDRAVCAIIKHANPCGVAVAGDLVTAYQRALECDERSAFGGIVAFNRPIDDATAAAMASGPQADVVIAPGYEGGRDRDPAHEAQEHPAARGARADRRRPGVPPDQRRVPRPGRRALRRRPRRLAGGHQGRTDRRAVGRRRARVAGVRPREVERDRAGEGRPGRRHRRRAAEPGRVGRDRGEEGRRAGRGAARARRTRSTRSPTASRPRPRPGVAVVVQPGGSVSDEKVITRADELGLAMVFTGERHFLH